MKSPIVKHTDGTVSWIPEKGDRFLVTGIEYRSNKRFRLSYDSWNYARCINLWRGSKWLLRGGKRFLIQRVTN